MQLTVRFLGIASRPVAARLLPVELKQLSDDKEVRELILAADFLDIPNVLTPAVHELASRVVDGATPEEVQARLGLRPVRSAATTLAYLQGVAKAKVPTNETPAARDAWLQQDPRYTEIVNAIHAATSNAAVAGANQTETARLLQQLPHLPFRNELRAQALEAFRQRNAYESATHNLLHDACGVVSSSVHVNAPARAHSRSCPRSLQARLVAQVVVPAWCLKGRDAYIALHRVITDGVPNIGSVTEMRACAAACLTEYEAERQKSSNWRTRRTRKGRWERVYVGPPKRNWRESFPGLTEFFENEATAADPAAKKDSLLLTEVEIENDGLRVEVSKRGAFVSDFVRAAAFGVAVEAFAVFVAHGCNCNDPKFVKELRERLKYLMVPWAIEWLIAVLGYGFFYAKNVFVFVQVVWLLMGGGAENVLDLRQSIKRYLEVCRTNSFVAKHRPNLQAAARLLGDPDDPRSLASTGASSVLAAVAKGAAFTCAKQTGRGAVQALCGPATAKLFGRYIGGAGLFGTVITVGELAVAASENDMRKMKRAVAVTVAGAAGQVAACAAAGAAGVVGFEFLALTIGAKFVCESLCGACTN